MAFQAWIPAGILSALAITSGAGVSSFKDEVHPKGKPPGLDAHETHATASLLGHFRTSISSWLWVRTDLYLHNGVVMRPLTEDEITAGRVGVGGHHDHEGEDKELGHDDSKIVTAIPTPETDFRGVFGDVERATQTWKDMRGHSHNDPHQALPLFRLMTWLDPYFTPGWTTGAGVLAMDKRPEAFQKAVDLLDEGLKFNPESIEILNQKGFTQIARQRKFLESVPTFKRAIATGREYRIEQIPEDDQEALLNSYRWLALAYRELGMIQAMFAIAQEGLERFPGDQPLTQTMQHHVSLERPKR
jgi:hypothetical protein